MVADQVHSDHEGICFSPPVCTFTMWLCIHERRLHDKISPSADLLLCSWSCFLLNRKTQRTLECSVWHSFNKILKSLQYVLAKREDSSAQITMCELNKLHLMGMENDWNGLTGAMGDNWHVFRLYLCMLCHEKNCIMSRKYHKGQVDW